MFREIIDKDFKQQIWIAENSPLLIDQKPEFYIARCGLFEGRGQYSMNYRAPYCFMYVFLEGETEIEIDNQQYIASKGDILFVFEGQHKKLKEKSHSPLKNYYIDLSGSAVERILHSMGIHPTQQFFHGTFDQDLRLLFDELSFECQKEYSSAIKFVSLAWRVLEEIQSKLPQSPLKTVELCERIKLLIEKDFRFGLTIEEIAQKVGHSRSTVFRQFKSKYSLSPKQYLEHLRLEFACDQLQFSNISISEIALNSGYNSVNHFIRMFKKQFAQTPLQYQKSFLQE